MQIKKIVWQFLYTSTIIFYIRQNISDTSNTRLVSYYLRVSSTHKRSSCKIQNTIKLAPLQMIYYYEKDMCTQIPNLIQHISLSGKLPRNPVIPPKAIYHFAIMPFFFPAALNLLL